MTFLDVARMALHNLWARKLRTVLNILGVVLACVVLAMTLAGTRGVGNGFQKIIHESEDVRKLMIYRAWKQQDDVPNEATQIVGEMSADRRERLQKRLKDKWLSSNSTRIPLNGESLQQLSRLPHMISVTPKVELSCSMTLDNVTDKASIALAPRDARAQERILFGDDLSESDHQGILLSEYGAYRLGYISDTQLQELVGREIEIAIQLSGEKVTRFLGMMVPGELPISSHTERMLAIKALVDDVDSTSLSKNEKGIIRELFSQSKSAPAEALFLKEKFTVRGITREELRVDIFALLRVAALDTKSDVYMTAERAGQIQMSKEGFETFWAAIGVVDEVKNLDAAAEQIKALGYKVISSNRIVKRINEELDRARLAISVLCLLILIISAIGISNTMVVSVLERTSEFGILKAMGARDGSILRLMLMEGALTGLVGAVVAILTSFALSKVAAIFVRMYVSGRIGAQFDASVFAFTGLDLIVIVTVAVFVCTVAAIFPAYRAARLDPVAAMRRN